jgi:hypothetical protein
VYVETVSTEPAGIRDGCLRENRVAHSACGSYAPYGVFSRAVLMCAMSDAPLRGLSRFCGGATVLWGDKGKMDAVEKGYGGFDESARAYQPRH